jgi:hypothetical protein
MISIPEQHGDEFKPFGTFRRGCHVGFAIIRPEVKTPTSNACFGRLWISHRVDSSPRASPQLKVQSRAAESPPPNTLVPTAKHGPAAV